MCTCNDIHLNVTRSDESHALCEPDISLFRKVQIVGISILYLGYDIKQFSRVTTPINRKKYKNRLYLKMKIFIVLSVWLTIHNSST